MADSPTESVVSLRVIYTYNGIWRQIVDNDDIDKSQRYCVSLVGVSVLASNVEIQVVRSLLCRCEMVRLVIIKPCRFHQLS